MATLYTWTIQDLGTLDTSIATDYVVEVHFTVTGTEDSYSYRIPGFITFEVKEMENFTPFSSLTHDEVVGWVKNTLSAEELAFYASKIQEEIESQKNPTPRVKYSRAPWVEEESFPRRGPKRTI